MSIFQTTVNQHIDTVVDDTGNRLCAWCATPLTGPDGQPVTQGEHSPELTGAVAAHIVHTAALNGWQPDPTTLASEILQILWNFTGFDLNDAVALTAGLVPLLEEHLDTVPFNLDSYR